MKMPPLHVQTKIERESVESVVAVARAEFCARFQMAHEMADRVGGDAAQMAMEQAELRLRDSLRAALEDIACASYLDGLYRVAADPRDSLRAALEDIACASFRDGLYRVAADPRAEPLEKRVDQIRAWARSEEVSEGESRCSD